MRFGLFLLVLIICIQLSLGGHHYRKGKGKGRHQRHHHAKRTKDYSKMSNPEMMVMMRMKKMLSPLRQLFTKVLDLGPRQYVDGRPLFCKDNECPAFTVLNKTDHYELREYEASNWVSTSKIAPFLDSKVQGSLFWPLFQYIQGSRIKMTVPVTNLVRPHDPSDGYNYTMSFFISPSIHHPPKPSNDKVFLEMKPRFKVYAHSFKGYAWNQEMWERHTDMLAQHLDDDGLQDKYYPRDQKYVTAGYDDPLKMFNRHNEVWLFAKD